MNCTVWVLGIELWSSGRVVCPAESSLQPYYNNSNIQRKDNLDADILLHRRLKQGDHKFKPSLSYILRPYLKTSAKDICQWSSICAACAWAGLGPSTTIIKSQLIMNLLDVCLLCPCKNLHVGIYNTCIFPKPQKKASCPSVNRAYLRTCFIFLLLTFITGCVKVMIFFWLFY